MGFFAKEGDVDDDENDGGICHRVYCGSAVVLAISGRGSGLALTGRDNMAGKKDNRKHAQHDERRIHEAIVAWRPDRPRRWLVKYGG